MDPDSLDNQEISTFLETLRTSPTITARFDYSHVVLALYNFAENSEGIGRYALGKSLNIGEGMSRSLVTKLREKNIITAKSTRKGHTLTPEGISLYNKIKSRIFYFGPAPDACKKVIVKGQPYLCFVRGSKRNVGLGIEIRDAAIKLGGYGATCFIIQQKKMKFPNDDAPIAAEIQDAIFKIRPLKDGDVIIVGAGETEVIAQLAALNAALSITDFLPK